MLLEFDSMIKDLRSTGESTEGHLRIAGASSMLDWLVIPSLSQFREAFPLITISLHESTAAGTDARVASGDADFGVTNDREDNPELNYVPLFRDMYGVICSADHPLATLRGDVTWKCLAEHSKGFIVFAADTRLGSFHRNIGADIGMLEFEEEISNSGRLSSMLKLGYRFSIVSALTARTQQLDQFVFRPLSPPVFREVSFVTRRLRSLSPTAHKLRDALVDYLNSSELPPGMELL